MSTGKINNMCDLLRTALFTHYQPNGHVAIKVRRIHDVDLAEFLEPEFKAMVLRLLEPKRVE